MNAIQIIAAVLTRCIFGTHAGITVWFVVQLKSNDAIFWTLLIGLCCLGVEAMFTIFARKGQEYRYLWPSCFFYLCTVVPSVWIIQLMALNLRITGGEGPVIYMSNNKLSLDFARMFCEVGLVLVIIAGRWMLPRGAISREQLSALLLEYVAIAADILELFGAFEEEQVANNETVTIVILVVYSWSLLQFTFSSTAFNDPDKEDDKSDEETKKKEEAELKEMVAGLPAVQRRYLRKMVMTERIKEKKLQKTRKRYRENSSARAVSTASLEEEEAQQMKKMQLHGDLLGILAGIFMQDGPFLVVRLYLIFSLGIQHELQIFFAAKNAVTIALLLYRLYAIQCVAEEDEKTPYERFRLASIAVLGVNRISKDVKRSTSSKDKGKDLNGNVGGMDDMKAKKNLSIFSANVP